MDIAWNEKITVLISKNLVNSQSDLDNEIIPDFKRDFGNLNDVSDDVFEIFKSQFDEFQQLFLI